MCTIMKFQFHYGTIESRLTTEKNILIMSMLIIVNVVKSDEIVVDL